MAQSLENLTAALLDAAKRAGATGADAIAVSGTSQSIDIRAGQLEQAERSEGIEIGLRVLIGGRQACADSQPGRFWGRCRICCADAVPPLRTSARHS